MTMLHIQTFIVNMIEENCYLIWDDSKEAVIIDCGAFFPEDRKAITDFVREKGLQLKTFLLTHGHFDHIFGAGFVQDTFGLLPQLSAKDELLYLDAKSQLMQFMQRELPIAVPPVGGLLRDGDRITFGNLELEVIACPGHTPGGLCFYNAEEKVLLSGDSLFQHSIGRTDFPGGNSETLVKSIRERLLTLPDDVTVFPGHGPSTTIGEEKHFNPYL